MHKCRDLPFGSTESSPTVGAEKVEYDPGKQVDLGLELLKILF